MEHPYLSKSLRQMVVDRSDHLCEYCLIHEDDTVLGCAIDHIISLKHGGPNTEDRVTILGVSSIGDATSRILGFNDRERLLERQILIDRGRYPHLLARSRMA